MNYIIAVCARCGAEFTSDGGKAHLCPLCDKLTTNPTATYELSVETGRALFAADREMHDGDFKSAVKAYKAAAKTDKKNPAPLLGILFCKHGVKYEDGKLRKSSGKLLSRDGVFKKLVKLCEPSRAERLTALVSDIDGAAQTLYNRPLKPNRASDFQIDGVELRYYKGDDETVVIPPFVKTVDAFALLFAKNVKSVHIPASVEKIESRAFTVYPPIERITVDPASKRFAVDNGCLVDKQRGAVIRGLPCAAIPDYITSIDEYAFEKCTDMTELVIPDGVTFVGEYAFGACDSLKRVVIPAGLTEIEDGAFSCCGGITEFVVADGNSVYCQRDGALYDKSENKVVRGGAEGKVPVGARVLGESSYDGGEFSELHIPATVTEICDRAIDGCYKLTRLTVDKDNPKYACVGNCLIDRDAHTLLTAFGDYSIPDDGSVKIIGEGVFRASERKSVTVPSAVQIIDECAFADGVFESVELNDGLEVIDEMAFTNCAYLTELKLPSSLKTIGEEAFSNCERLKRVNIPASVEIIDQSAFLFCDKLESAVFESFDGWVYDNINSGERVDGEILSDAWCAADILKNGRKLVKRK